jgi:hypothetical protein
MELKQQVLDKLNSLSEKDSKKVQQIYKITNKIKGGTNEEFVNNLPDSRTMQGVINMCTKQLK